LVPIRVRTPLGPAILIEELGDARFGNSQKLGAETSRLRAKRGRFRIQFFRNRFPESGALIGGSRSANSQKIARGILVNSRRNADDSGSNSFENLVFKSRMPHPVSLLFWKSDLLESSRGRRAFSTDSKIFEGSPRGSKIEVAKLKIQD